MAHRLVEQHAEVLPLNGGGILELVDHHVLQLGADLLEDEGRVAVADQGVEQLLGVAEQKSVGIGIQFVDLLFDATQKPQLVEVAQREVSTLVNTPLTGPCFNSLTQQIVEWSVGKGMEQLTTGVALLVPF